MIDKVGRDLSKPIEPMSVEDWEGGQIDGESALLGAKKCGETEKEQSERLGKIILAMSAEIFRLRLTYGEEVWKSVYHTDEEDEFTRKVHEAERGKHQIDRSLPFVWRIGNLGYAEKNVTDIHGWHKMFGRLWWKEATNTRSGRKVVQKNNVVYGDCVGGNLIKRSGSKNDS